MFPVVDRPNILESLNAISGLMPLLPVITRLSVDGETASFSKMWGRIHYSTLIPSQSHLFLTKCIRPGFFGFLCPAHSRTPLKPHLRGVQFSTRPIADICTSGSTAAHWSFNDILTLPDLGSEHLCFIYLRVILYYL
jgi:hypothetical protein